MKKSIQESAKQFKKDLNKDLFYKTVLIPLLFALVAIIVCIIISNPKLELFKDIDKESETASSLASYQDIEQDVNYGEQTNE